MTLTEFLTARESDEWAHDPYGQLPDEVWAGLSVVQWARVSVAFRGLVWVLLDTSPLTRWVVQRVAQKYRWHPDYDPAWA